MNLLETTAYAAEGPGSEAGIFQLVTLGVFVLIFYFLLIRPQNKRRKEHQNLITSLSEGDEVVTAGGMLGKITKVDDEFIKVLVGEGVELRFQKSSIGASLPKGTIKSLENGK